MEHSPGFLKLVNEVRPQISEITVEEARKRLDKNPNAILLDIHYCQPDRRVITACHVI